MSFFDGVQYERQFFKYLQALSNKMLSIDIGDHEILWGKVLISPNERHFKASSRIHWEKMAICQFPTRSFGVTYPKEVTHLCNLLLNLIWGSKHMYLSHKPIRWQSPSPMKLGNIDYTYAICGCLSCYLLCYLPWNLWNVTLSMVMQSDIQFINLLFYLICY